MILVTTRKTDFAGVLLTPWTAAGLLALYTVVVVVPGRLAARPAGRLSGPAAAVTPVAARALVLGGGGVAGIAWHTGVLLGLAEVGVPTSRTPTSWSGTSAGATVAAQLGGGRPLGELFDRQVDPATLVTELDPAGDHRRAGRPGWRPSTPAGPRRRRAPPPLGAMALAADTVDEDVRRAVLAARLVGNEWPAPVACWCRGRRRRPAPAGCSTARRASTWSTPWPRRCAVPGVWPPVTIGGARYIDGGVWSLTNADLATGCDRVLVLAPIVDPTRRGRGGRHWPAAAVVGAGASGRRLARGVRGRRAGPRHPRARRPGRAGPGPGRGRTGGRPARRLTRTAVRLRPSVAPAVVPGGSSRREARGGHDGHGPAVGPGHAACRTRPRRWPRRRRRTAGRSPSSMALRTAAPSSVSARCSAEPAGRTQPRSRRPLGGRRPFVVGPAPGGPKEGHGELAGGLVEHEGLEAIDPVVDQQGDVAVAAELPQQGLGVPQDVEWFARASPGRRGRRTAGVPRGARTPASAARRARSAAAATSSPSADAPSIRRSAAAAAACGRPEPRPGSWCPHARHGLVDQRGPEVEEGGDHGAGRDRAERGRPGGEVAGLARQAQVRVGLGRLGREVDHAVQRLDRPPGLPTQ